GNCHCLSFTTLAAPRALHSFPTRRSSDLPPLSASGPSWGSRFTRSLDAATYPQPAVLPIRLKPSEVIGVAALQSGVLVGPAAESDRKSTRLNSSHRTISYAVFCLKKKNKT